MSDFKRSDVLFVGNQFWRQTFLTLWKNTLIYKTPKETPADVASLVHKCRNQDCAHCTVKGFTSRDLCTSLSIAATKTVDCSFIKAEHSTQVSSKNNSRKNTCIAKQFAVPPPVSQSFHLLNNHKFLHIYCLQRSVLPSKNTVFESCIKNNFAASFSEFLFSCSVL